MLMCTVKQMPTGAKDVESIGIGFTYGYEPHYLGLGKETRIFCKSSLYSQLLAISPIPEEIKIIA